MSARETDASAVERLAAAGFAPGDVRDWLQAEPGETTDFPADRKKFSGYWQKSARLLGRLPPKARRNEREQAAADVDRGPGARGARALSAPPWRCRLRRVDGAAVALRAGRGPGDPGRRRGAGPGADRAGDRRRGRLPAARQERPRDRPGPVSVRRARQRALRTAPLPRHAAAAARGRGPAAAVRARRQGRARRRVGSSRRQGRGGDPEQSALSQRGGSDLARRRRNLRRSRAARPRERDRRHARRGGRASEIPGAPRLRRRHQSHASLSRPHPVRVVSPARSRLREQDLSRACLRRRRAARRVRRQVASRSRGSPRSKPSPSAATARPCW